MRDQFVRHRRVPPLHRVTMRWAHRRRPDQPRYLRAHAQLAPLNCGHLIPPSRHRQPATPADRSVGVFSRMLPVNTHSWETTGLRRGLGLSCPCSLLCLALTSRPAAAATPRAESPPSSRARPAATPPRRCDRGALGAAGRARREESDVSTRRWNWPLELGDVAFASPAASDRVLDCDQKTNS